MRAFVFVSLFYVSVLLLIMNYVINKIALNVEKPYKLQWARYTFVNTKNNQKKKIKGEITIYILVILSPVQTPLHSRAGPNSIKFHVGASLERRLIQTAYLRQI